MNRIKLTTPENIEIEYKLADLGSRTGAVIIDMMIQGLILLLLFAGVILVGSLQSELWNNYSGWVIGSSLLIYMLISYGYYIVMELNMNGMTPGKKILKIRTIRKNGQPLTLKHSAIRNLFRIFIDMTGIGPLFIFFTKEHRRVGDFAASTIVVVEERKSRPVVLEIGQQKIDRIKNYLSEEEYELLCDYLKRKDNLKKPSILRAKLKDYLTKKYEGSETTEAIVEVIKEI